MFFLFRLNLSRLDCSYLNGKLYIHVTCVRVETDRASILQYYRIHQFQNLTFFLHKTIYFNVHTSIKFTTNNEFQLQNILLNSFTQSALVCYNMHYSFVWNVINEPIFAWIFLFFFPSLEFWNVILLLNWTWKCIFGYSIHYIYIAIWLSQHHKRISVCDIQFMSYPLSLIWHFLFTATYF